MKRILFLLFPVLTIAQGYTSYFTGNTTNTTTNTEFGICLMGGATEHDEAMKWLLQKANGGDVVVLRSSGSDGYNSYLYSELGITINSVETLVITSASGAVHPYVLNKVANAEMLWFAGGDQWNYVSYFKNNALEDLINNHINVKQAPIGGTSAGMAILGSNYFSAQNGTITSSQALLNPFHSGMTLGHNDFIQTSLLANVITDTHYDNPDRRGRHAGFLARLKNDYGIDAFGIAANEYVAICIDSYGKARVYGDYPNYQEFAYFIKPNCMNTNAIETMQSGQPLTWNYGGQALVVYKVPGTMLGTHFFDLSNWDSGIVSGGTWEFWSVTNGALSVQPGTSISCALGNENFQEAVIGIMPQPVESHFMIQGTTDELVELYDFSGRLITTIPYIQNQEVEVSSLSPGLYFLGVDYGNKKVMVKFLKK